jgi:hypothetical protein
VYYSRLISLHLVSEKYRRAPIIGNNAETNMATATLGAWENSLYMRFLPYLQPERALDLFTMRVSMDCITQGIIQYPAVMLGGRCLSAVTEIEMQRSAGKINE